MTDPRIIECAKAIVPMLNDRDEDNVPTGTDSMMPIAVGIATACVLKWLEQEPTVEMIEAGQATDGGPWDRSGCSVHYPAMCAQAAKEIAGE